MRGRRARRRMRSERFIDTVSAGDDGTLAEVAGPRQPGCAIPGLGSVSDERTRDLGVRHPTNPRSDPARFSLTTPHALGYRPREPTRGTSMSHTPASVVVRLLVVVLIGIVPGV